MDRERKKLEIELSKTIRSYFLHHAIRDHRGYIKCPLRNRWYPESEMQICHFIDRKMKITKYEKDNLCLCSKQSNYWDAQRMVEGFKSTHHRDFEEYLGEEKVEELTSLSKNLISLSEQDLKDYIDEYRIN